MKYIDSKGKTYEISYSQKLQREQNRIARQKNSLLTVIIFIMILFGVGLAYLYWRLESIDLLTKLVLSLNT